MNLVFLGFIGAFIYMGYGGSLETTFDVLLTKISYFAYNAFSSIDSILFNGEEISEQEALKLSKSSNILDVNSYSVDSEYYPYYHMLNDNEKYVYLLLCKNVKELSSSFNIPVSVSADEVQNVIEAVYNDHPEFFWVKNKYSYKYTQSGNVIQILLEYYFDSTTIEKARKDFDFKVNEIVEEASVLNNAYEKEKYVHNVLIENVDYVEDAIMNQSAYSALVNGNSVCAGYSKAFQYILMKLGIPTYYVTGDADGDHAWNIVKINDEYYNVDITWNDSARNKYSYFNIADSIFSNSHIRRGLSVNLPDCNGYMPVSNKSYYSVGN